MLKKLIRHAVGGLLIGALTYLVLIVIAGKSIYVMPLMVVNVLLLSLLIGILSMIFDIERLNFTSALSIHYFGVLLLVSLMDILNYWSRYFDLHIGELIIGTTLVYIVIWLGLHLMSVINIRQINERIKKIDKIISKKLRAK